MYAEEAEFRPEECRARLSGRAATFVSAVNGTDVGMVTGAEWHRRKEDAGLLGMWVAPETRCRGVGEELLRAVISWARSCGFSRVVLDVADDNGPAIELYARMGFQPTGSTSNLPSPREQISEHERALEL